MTNVDGIEITLSSFEELDTLDWSFISDLVQDFNFVSVHSPINIDHKYTCLDQGLIDQLDKFRSVVGASTVVFHPNKLFNVEILSGIRASVENMQYSKGFDRDDFKEFVNSSIPIVVDSVHANTWSNNGFKNEFVYMLHKYRNRISHIHTSVNGSSEEHEPFVDNPKRLDSLSDFLEDRTVILESKFSEPQQVFNEVELFREKVM